MVEFNMILAELAGKVSAIINSGAKSKSVVGQISHAIEQLESRYECGIDHVLVNHIVTEASNKNKHEKTLSSLGSCADILEQMLVYQCMFYELSGDVSDSIMQRYSLMLYVRGEIHKALLEGLGGVLSSIEFPFKMWLNLPLAVNVMQLEKFKDATEKTMRVVCKNMERDIRESGEKGLMLFWVFNTDVIGNEDKWRETIREWGISYLIYKSHYVDGLTKTDIVENMKHVRRLFTNPDDKSNSIHQLDPYLDEAERLIQSAQIGIFPR